MKTLSVVLAVVAVVSAACAGPVGGNSEGDSCSGAEDCASNLTCQPIKGRQGDFCCPTPAGSSQHSNCQTK